MDKVDKVQYSFSFLRKFISEGRLHGSVGMLLIKKEGNRYTYTGYGTIENPCKERFYLTMISNPAFDDNKTDFKTSGSYTFMLLDLNK